MIQTLVATPDPEWDAFVEAHTPRIADDVVVDMLKYRNRQQVWPQENEPIKDDRIMRSIGPKDLQRYVSWN